MEAAGVLYLPQAIGKMQDAPLQPRPSTPKAAVKAKGLLVPPTRDLALGQNQIEASLVVVGKQIGKGRFGQVFEGTLNGVVVATKVQYTGGDEQLKVF